VTYMSNTIYLLLIDGNGVFFCGRVLHFTIILLSHSKVPGQLIPKGMEEDSSAIAILSCKRPRIVMSG
jgi:hypothetical protein